MNIFRLDDDPEIAAQMSCDRHVLSGCREMTIMLSYVGKPPKRGYYHHKCSKWIRESEANYHWALSHAFALCKEYTYRYGKRHKNEDVLEEIAGKQFLFDKKDETPPALAIPNDISLYDFSACKVYRRYYLKYKNHLLTYTRREIPEWIKEEGLGSWRQVKHEA